MFVKGAPLLEPSGATIGTHKTQIRALFNRSIPAGGDSSVRVKDGVLTIGPDRQGPAAAFGGPSPTPTDALVVLGRTSAARDRATAALAPVAEALGLAVESAAVRIVETLAHTVAEAARAYVAEVNGRPVYTIREFLAGHKVRPVRAVMVGGPARALAPYVERELGLPVHVGAHFDVANAVGAAVAKVNLEVNAFADTAEGRFTIPEAGVHREIGSGFTLADTRRAAEEALAGLARESGLAPEDFVAETVEEESFRIVEGYSARGSVHRLRMQVRPSILFKVES
jgi:N-methylhydantoinase A/oxoprolinase/acetone carboxylase beta subunit